ncbi:MAG: hypothetical protein ACSLFB_09945 [Acidimicrobiales bacterium]
MLVLVSFALVLLALMLLIFGVLSSDGLGMIYISIICSLGAAVVLYIATRPKSTKPGAKPVASGLAPPLDTPGRIDSAVTSSGGSDTMTMATVGPITASSPVIELPASDPEDQPFFPIADYDDLTISEILPLLKELYDDELEAVEAHESLTKERLAIMTAISDVRSRLATTDQDLTFSEMTAMGAVAPEDKVPSLTVPSGWENEVAGEEYEDEEDYEEEEYEDEDEDEDEWAEPTGIEQYEDLPVSEIRELLSRLDEDDLFRLRDVEEEGRGRRSVLDAIDRELALFQPEAPARKAVAKKAPARKAVAKKAPARKAAPVKKAPTRKAVAKKAPARRPAAPVRKAVAKKAPARRPAAPVRKAVAKKAARRTR